MLKNIESFNLLSDIEENIIDISEDAINAFISSCQNEKCQINSQDLIPLQYLSNKYDVPQLIKITNDLLSKNYDDLFFQSFLFKTKFVQKIQNENDENIVMSFFNTTKEEEIFVEKFNKLIKNDKIFLLSISSLERIFQKFSLNPKNKKFLNSSEMIEFLFKCLDKYGRDASILFSIIDFEHQTVDVVDRLLRNYSEIFDFNMINSSLLKTTKFLTSEVSKMREECSNTISQMKKQFDEMILINKKKEEDDEKRKKEKERKFDEEMKTRIKLFEKDMKTKIELFDKEIQDLESEKDSLIQSINFAEKTKSSLDFIFKEMENQVINSDIINFLYQNKILKSFITDYLNISSDFLIELKYPSKNYKNIYNVILDVKKANPEKSSKIKVLLIASKIDDKCFKGNEIVNFFKILPSIKAIKVFSFANCLALSQIILPPSITIIGNYAFEGCILLQKIDIPSSVEKIMEFTFLNYSSLTDVSIPSSVTFIGKGAFDGCSKLNLIVPSTLTRFESGIYSNNMQLQNYTSAIAFTNLSTDLTAKDVGDFFGEFKITDVTILARFSQGHYSSTGTGFALFHSAISFKEVSSRLKNSGYKWQISPSMLTDKELDIINK